LQGFPESITSTLTLDGNGQPRTNEGQIHLINGSTEKSNTYKDLPRLRAAERPAEEPPTIITSYFGTEVVVDIKETVQGQEADQRKSQKASILLHSEIT